MDAGLYIAASGMLAQQVREDQLANDLSNSSTPGYKSDSSVQSGLRLAAAVQHGHRPVDRHDQHRREARIAADDLTPEALHSTGQPLDFGIAGQGFFAVRTAQGVQYTRDGQFEENGQGPPRRRPGQRRALAERRHDPGQRPGHGARLLGRCASTSPTRPSRATTTSPARLRASGSGIGQAGRARELRRRCGHHDGEHDLARPQTYQAGENAIQTIDSTMQESSSSVGLAPGG